jgi:hypothetical protein
MIKHNKVLIGLFVISAVMLFMGLSAPIRPPPQSRGVCIDTDYSYNQCVSGTNCVDLQHKGSVYMNYIDRRALIYTDKCTSFNYLKESYCYNNYPYYVGYSCPNGCFNGACIIL